MISKPDGVAPSYSTVSVGTKCHQRPKGPGLEGLKQKLILRNSLTIAYNELLLTS